MTEAAERTSPALASEITGLFPHLIDADSATSPTHGAVLIHNGIRVVQAANSVPSDGKHQVKSEITSSLVPLTGSLDFVSVTFTVDEPSRLDLVENLNLVVARCADGVAHLLKEQPEAFAVFAETFNERTGDADISRAFRQRAATPLRSHLQRLMSTRTEIR